MKHWSDKAGSFFLWE